MLNDALDRESSFIVCKCLMRVVRDSLMEMYTIDLFIVIW